MDKNKDISSLSTRKAARLTGVPAATISRIRNGGDYRISTAKKLLPNLAICPCCGLHLGKAE